MYNQLLLIVLLAICFACGRETSPDKTTVLSGKLPEVEGGLVILHRGADRVSYTEWLSAVDTASAGEDGSFAFSFPQTEAEFYQVRNLQGYPQFADVYLRPGDSLYVAVTKEERKTQSQYEGALADAYAYQNLLDSAWQADKVFSLGYRDLCELTKDSAQVLIADRMAREKALWQSHFDQHPEWAPVARHFWDQRYYEILSNYYSYLYYHHYCVDDSFHYLLPGEEYYAFLDDVDLTYVSDQYIWSYQYFIRQYLSDKAEHTYGDLPDSVYWKNRLTYLFEMARTHFTGKARDAAFFALTAEFADGLQSDGFFDLISEQEQFMIDHHTSPQLLKKFQYICRQFDALKPGSPVPDLALPDINGDTIRLSDLKGNVLYIDFWGTWCYPCLQEMPHSLDLHEKLKDEDVKFVFVGLQAEGEQVEEWRQFVSGEIALSYAPFLEQQKYPGVHLLSEGQFNNPQLKPFRINSAPTYMLVDAGGRILQGRASRPGNPDTELAIREALLRD